MSISFKQGSNQVLLLTPVEFKRIYTRVFAGNGPGKLEYSHSDCVVTLANDSRANIEVIQETMPAGNYTVHAMPSDLSFEVEINSETECITRIKRLIWMCYPDLLTLDTYLNRSLPRP